MGFIKGVPTCITGNTSAGKSTLCKKLVVYDSIEYAIKKNLDLKIIYFGFEESKQQAQYHMFSYICAKHGIRLSIIDFEFMSKKGVSDINLTQMEQLGLDKMYEKWWSYVEWYDVPTTAFGVYARVRDIAAERGVFTYKGEVFDTTAIHKDNETSWDTYTPNNPNEFVIVVFDHLRKIKPRNGQSKHEAMQELSDFFQNQIAYKFDYCPIIVHQQKNENQNLSHVQANAWMPTLEGLGGNNEVSQDYRIVLGIGNPYRYKIKQYAGYNLEMFQKGMLRFINIIKQTYGPPDIEIGVIFDGKTGTIETAPRPDDTQALSLLQLVRHE